jgi:sodium-dependent dicarboxylate transporter 2/3/5
MYGLPLVPVMSFCVGLYFLLVLRPKVKVKSLDATTIVRRASEKIGPMTREEYVTLAVLIGVIVLWITCSTSLGMGGPVILGLVILNILRVASWKDIAGIHWEVVFLYASASAIGKGLAVTGWRPVPRRRLRRRPTGLHARGRRPGHRLELLHRHRDQLHE